MQKESRDPFLLKNWLQGDSSFGKKLVTETYPKVFKYVASKLSINMQNRQFIIEEIVAEAFTSIMEDIEKYDCIHDFYPWVCGYARNIIKSKYRELKKLGNVERLDDIMYLVGFEVSVFENPEEYVLILEEHEALKEAYKSLKPKYRKIIKQRLIQGMPYNEIAIYEKKSVDSLESLFRRALQDLRKKYLKIYEKSYKKSDGKLTKTTIYI